MLKPAVEPHLVLVKYRGIPSGSTDGQYTSYHALFT